MNRFVQIGCRTRWTGGLTMRCGCLRRALLLVCLGAATHGATAQDARLAEELHQGNEAMRGGHPEAAVVHYRAVVEQAPRMAEGYLNLGLAYEQMGNQADAAAALTKAIALKPTLPGAGLFLGIADYRLNRLDAAVKALRVEVAQSPNSAKPLMWLGVTLLAENKAQEAAAALDKASALDPKDLDIMYHRGRAHLLVSKDAYEGMFAASPDYWRVHQVLAEAYGEADRHADAITEYKMAVKAAPREPGLHDRMGDELWKQGTLDEADAAFAEELRLDPNSVLAMYHLGRLRVTRSDHGQVENGVGLLRQALAEDPSMSQVEYYLGRGTAVLGKNEEAIRYYESSVKGDPSGDVAQQAYYQLAHLYRQMKRPDDAKVALENFTRLKQQFDADEKHKFEKSFNPEAEIAEKSVPEKMTSEKTRIAP